MSWGKNAFYSSLKIQSIFRFVKYFVSFVGDALRYSDSYQTHTPLNDVYPDVAVFFSSYCNDFFTALSISVVSTIRTSIT